MDRKRIGVVLVHGMGRQQRYETIQRFLPTFERAIRRTVRGESIDLFVDKIELSRQGTRMREIGGLSSILAGAREDDTKARKQLFRPVTIRVGAREVRLYEAYWADEDLAFNRFRKLAFNVWLASTVWFPFAHWIYNKWPLFARWIRAKTGRGSSDEMSDAGESDDTPRFGRFESRGPLALLRHAGWMLLVFVLHVAESLAAVLSVMLRNAGPFSATSDLIYEYAGDIKLYVDERARFLGTGSETSSSLGLTR